MSGPPPDAALLPAERALVAQLDTPLRVQRWLDTLPYNREIEGPSVRSFRGVLATGSAHCLEGAIAAAAILERHGYPPLLLNLDSADHLGHAAFVFRKAGRYGAVARSRYPGLHGRRPVFRSLRDLAWSYFDPFVDHTGEVVGYALVDLSRLGGADWRLARGNVWRVEQALINAPHTPLKGSRARVARLRAAYRVFKSGHPQEEPPRYPGHERWL